MAESEPLLVDVATGDSVPLSSITQDRVIVVLFRHCL